MAKTINADCGLAPVAATVANNAAPFPSNKWVPPPEGYGQEQWPPSPTFADLNITHMKSNRMRVAPGL
jgi:hypothetical protein